MNKINIIYYDKIDVSEGIHGNETSASKNVIFVPIGTFYMKSLSFSLDLLMMSKNLNDIDILNINDVDYRCIISQINKSEAINLLQNADLTKK